MRRLLTVTTVLIAISLSCFAQDATVPKPCIAPGEPIHRPGEKGLIPPQPQPQKDAKDAPKIRGPLSLQLVVNTEGRVCSAKVLSARDNSAAKRSADYIVQNWSFRPSTIDGKTVATTFTVNFTE